MKTKCTVVIACILLFAAQIKAQQTNVAGVTATGYQKNTFKVIPGNAWNQTTLYGKITDINGKPLAAVNIFIPELEKGAISNNDGTFRIYNVHNGVITLECSHVSYLTLVQTVDVTRAEEVLIRLEPSAKSMEEIVVTSNHANLAGNTPYTINSVSRADIAKSAQSTLIETLGQQRGIDVISGGSGIGKPVIRGLSFNRIVLYSLGTKIENQQWDDDHDAGINEAGVDRMEIVYGPSALIYGADALGGAIVFIDEKNPPAGKTAGNINLGLFSNTAGVNIAAGIKHTASSGFFYSANINSQSHADYLQGIDNSGVRAFAANSKFNNLGGKIKMGVSRRWGVSKLSYSFLRSHTGMVVEPGEDSIAAAGGHPYDHRGYKLQAPYQDVAIHVISSENTLLAGSSRWSVNAAFQINNRKEFEPELLGQPAHLSLGLLLHTFTTDIKWSSNEEKKIGFTFGAQAMMQSNKNYGNNIAVPDATVNDFAGYGLIHYNTGNWNFLGGARIDLRSIAIKATTGKYEGEATLDSLEQDALDSSGLKRKVTDFKKNYYPVSFSAGIVHHFTKDISLKLNLATGFSAPNYAELSTFGKHEGTNRFEIGTPSLKAEQNIEGDLDLSLDKADFSVNASAFYNAIRGYIYLSPTSDSVYDLQVIAYKQNSAVIAGGELAVGLHPVGIKWLQLNSALTINSGKLTGGGYLPYFPPGKVTTELKFLADSLGRFSHPSISFVMNRHFAQDHPALYEDATGGYILLDVNAGADFRIGKQMIHAHVFCTNIFNTAYFNHLSILKDIGVYERGRNFGLRVNVPFGN